MELVKNMELVKEAENVSPTFNIADLMQEAFKELQTTQEAFFQARGKVQFLQDLQSRLQPQSEAEHIN